MLTNTEHKKYVRDKRSPVPKDESISRVMSANRPKDTGPEISLRKELRRYKMTGYRLHRRVGTTRPDIVFGKKKLAIFVNGCFWHACPHCRLSPPSNNSNFWKEKFQRNKERDKRKALELRRLGWKVITVWECSLKKDKEKEVRKIYKLFSK